MLANPSYIYIFLQQSQLFILLKVNFALVYFYYLKESKIFVDSGILHIQVSVYKGEKKEKKTLPCGSKV